MSVNVTRAPDPGSAEYRICTQCIMDTSAREIRFDEAGVCSFCNIYDHRNEAERHGGPEGWALLEQLSERVRADGRGREYDCLIGVSGGVDSSMVVRVASELGLRPLAIHFDNGWDSELAVGNVATLLDRLSIDLETVVVDWQEFRDLQLSFLRASVPNVEVPTDHAINAVIYKTAAKRGIKWVLGGGNVRTEAFTPSSWGHDSRDLKHLQAIHRRFGSHSLRTMPQISLAAWAYIVGVRRIRTIRPLNFFDYRRDEAKAALIADYEWRDYGGKHHESLFTKFFQGYILPTKFGYDKRRAHLSNLVCGGELSRDDALAEVAKPHYEPAALDAELDYVLKKFGLSRDEFEAVMALPPRSHREYPGHHYLFRDEDRWILDRVKRVATSA